MKSKPCSQQEKQKVPRFQPRCKRSKNGYCIATLDSNIYSLSQDVCPGINSNATTKRRHQVGCYQPPDTRYFNRHQNEYVKVYQIHVLAELAILC